MNIANDNMTESNFDQRSPNRFQDRAPLIVLTTIALLGAVVVFFAVFVKDLNTYFADSIFAGIAVVVMIGSFIAIFTNKLKVATIFISSLLFVVAWFFAFTYNYPTFNAFSIAMLFITVPLVGLYIGRGGTIVATSIAIGIIITLYGMGLAGIRPEIDGLEDLILISFALIMVGYMFEFTYERLKGTIQINSTQSIELKQKNTWLEEHQANLALEIESRTQELKRQIQLTEAATDVGQAATSIYNLDELLPQVSQFIADRFSYYHVGVFLVDDINEYAVMRSSNSDGGKRLIARGLRLKIGEEGLIGQVTSSGEARFVSNIQEDDNFLDAPELPDTRSEIVLPLFSGGRILGALDIQSQRENEFTEEDITTLRVLADQVSMAINNALLFEQLQSSLESERRAYGLVGLQGWQEIIGSRGDQGFIYKDKKTSVTTGGWATSMREAIDNNQPVLEDDGRTLAVPLSLNENPIGVIRLKKNPGMSEWVSEEISLIESIAERLTQSLESARLFQETQRQAAHQRMTTEISSSMRESLDIDAVLRTAAQELGVALNAKELIIRLDSRAR